MSTNPTTNKKTTTKKATTKKTTAVKKSAPKKAIVKKPATKKVATRKPAVKTKSSTRTANDKPKTNVVGLIGLILASFAVFIGWLPIFGWALWLAGLILSTIGVVSKPRTTSIIGIVLSFVAFIGIVMFLLILANN